MILFIPFLPAQTPGSVTASLYQVISGPAGQVRDWSMFRSLFAENARLGVSVRGQVFTFTPDEYVNQATPAFAKEGFFEHEIYRKTEEFGGMVHVWSTYESRKAPQEAKPFERGINSILLAQVGNAWKIINITWVPESPEFPIPGRYLPSK